MVSDATYCSPLSYCFRLLGWENFTGYPRARKKVLQKGMLSQNSSTRGSPTVSRCASRTGVTGYCLNSSCCRSRNRSGTASAFWAGAASSAITAPRSHRLPVT